MEYLNKIKLNKIKNPKKTGALITFDAKSMKIVKVVLYLAKNGYGIEHELNELDIIEIVLKICPEIIDFDWRICRSVFHGMAKGKHI